MMRISDMRRAFSFALVTISTFVASVSCAGLDEIAQESHRIRIHNAKGGLVQVSVDRGESYSTVGRVTLPAVRSMPGFAAGEYADPGTVAAIAVHAIRIRSGNASPRNAWPPVFSIIPREFESPSTGYENGSSGIYTDIPAGTAIFRNLSPLVGNPVFLEVNGRLSPLSRDYMPSSGDKLVITVLVPRRRPSEIVIENRRGGAVQAVYGDSIERIAVVEKPVAGTGRFDATEYTGVGCINTNHCGVITVSTAPRVGQTARHGEQRGGFQILPSRHAHRIGMIPQYMVVAPIDAGSATLEGQPPLFQGFIGLASDADTPGRSFGVEVRAGGVDWLPIKQLIGKNDRSLVDYRGVGEPMTHLRLIFPDASEEWLAQQVRKAAESHVVRSYGGQRSAGDEFNFALSGSDLSAVQTASLFVDGEFRGISTSPPFTFRINTLKYNPGEHRVEIRGLNGAGLVVATSESWFYTVSPEEAQRSSLSPGNSTD